MISKSNWQLVNGISTKFKINEDYDLSFRQTKLNVKITRLPLKSCNHHTIYNDEKRGRDFISQGNNLYSALLYRTHFFSKKCQSHTIRKNYSAFILFIILISVKFDLGTFFSIIIGLYGIIFIIKTTINSLTARTKKSNPVIYFIKRFIYQFLNDIVFMGGFFTFFPKGYPLEYLK